eukprot:1139793-Pelagomonas_calceolata.AAC.4
MEVFWGNKNVPLVEVEEAACREEKSWPGDGCLRTRVRMHTHPPLVHSVIVSTREVEREKTCYTSLYALPVHNSDPLVQQQ